MRERVIRGTLSVLAWVATSCSEGTQSGQLDIASADEDADPLAAQLVLHTPRCCETKTSGRFDHNLHSLSKEAHALHKFGVRHSQDVVYVTPDDGKRVLAEMLDPAPTAMGCGVLMWTIAPNGTA